MADEEREKRLELLILMALATVENIEDELELLRSYLKLIRAELRGGGDGGKGKD